MNWPEPPETPTEIFRRLLADVKRSYGYSNSEEHSADVVARDMIELIEALWRSTRVLTGLGTESPHNT